MKFAASKNCVLLCTDVAARGLDNLDVDWVLQFNSLHRTLTLTSIELDALRDLDVREMHYCL